MKIGAIVRCDDRGLGIQSREFVRHIPCRVLVVDVSKVNTTTPQHQDWYPGAQVWYYTKGGRVDPQIAKTFLDGLDVLIAFETPYDYSIFSLARLMGIKTVLQLNYEFLEYPSDFPLPDLFAAPSLWHYENIPMPKRFLPVPVDTVKFEQHRKERTFVHIGGKPAVHDRNGTFSFLNCLKYVKNNITVELKCQQRLPEVEVPSNVNLVKDYENKKNYYENYTGGVLVMPRKYGGLSLPFNEALASGMPIITTDISPNNKWLPERWLVPAQKTGSFKCKKIIEIYEADSHALAQKIDEFCDPNFYHREADIAAAMGKSISWQVLAPAYLQMFADLIA